MAPLSRKASVTASRKALGKTSTANGALPHTVLMVDGGSSGSKLFRLTGDGEVPCTLRVLTECQDVSRFNLRGISALSYNKSQCNPVVSVDPQDAKQLSIQLCPEALAFSDNTRYARILLEQMRHMHERSPEREGDILSRPPDNAKRIPTLATAGMRLLMEEQNHAVWSKVCGVKPDDGKYAFATESQKCGTIPGTTEAYYEFLAKLAQFDDDRLTATFTIGGASAQIALPLATQEDLNLFDMLERSVNSTLGNCSDIHLSNGHLIPTFSPKDVPCYKSSTRAALPTYLHIFGRGEAWRPTMCHAQAFISFLGLGHNSSKIGIAGGSNSIEAWAQSVGCGVRGRRDGAYDFEKCKQMLDVALRNDALFSAVSLFFVASRMEIQQFNFNTPATNPIKMFADKDVDEDEIQFLTETMEAESWKPQRDVFNRLNRVLWKECSSGGRFAGGFGFNHDNTCMKAYFAGIFAVLVLRAHGVRNIGVTLLKHHGSLLTGILPTWFTGQYGHFAPKLYWHKLDWSSGLYEDTCMSPTQEVND